MAWSDAARQASIEARQAAKAVAAKSNGIAHQQGIAHVASNMSPPDGTYDRYGNTPATGYMVGGAPTHGTRYTGVWTDPASGQTFREKSNRVDSAVLAKSLARRRNQIAIWDLTHKRQITTGGTGDYTPPRH